VNFFLIAHCSGIDRTNSCRSENAASNAGRSEVLAINKSRGRLIYLEDGTTVLVTVHPSYLLRQPDEDAKARGIRAVCR
jgi:uracil-DNA glycosylase